MEVAMYKRVRLIHINNRSICMQKPLKFSQLKIIPTKAIGEGKIIVNKIDAQLILNGVKTSQFYYKRVIKQ